MNISIFGLLEADSKSLCSVNGARRASASSPGPGSLALSQLGPLEEETWSLWGRIVSDWDEWRKKKEKLLKELIRKGIPQQFRAAGWQRLCGAAELPLKARYPELLWVSLPCERLICRNFARTYPEHTLFSGQRSLGQQVLFNVRKSAARSRPQDPEHKNPLISLGKKTHQSRTLNKTSPDFPGKENSPVQVPAISL
nr:EVI5-like protein isoform X1 [Taeniopygia guttata]